jgi:AraC-like DNA-binding protein
LTGKRENGYNSGLIKMVTFVFRLKASKKISILIMNPLLEHLPPTSGESFFCKAFELPYFDSPWHYHPEFELVLIVESKGKRFIGNTVSDFKEGDLSFFGSNLPHFYKNPPEYYSHGSTLKARSIVIHFLQDSLGKGFMDLPQSVKLESFFTQSQHGIDILGETRKRVSQLLHKVIGTSGLKRFIHLLEILDLLSDSPHLELISHSAIIGSNPLDAGRLNTVFEFVLKNFDREISLAEVADLIFMTRTSFCRFFLDRTKRTFLDFLIDFRINHAKKLLKETDKKVSIVSNLCGFNNLSYFNRKFKEKIQKTPKNYRKFNAN